MAVNTSASEEKKIPKCNVKKKKSIVIYMHIFIVLLIYQSHNFPVED